jgi:hypothetical protein
LSCVIAPRTLFAYAQEDVVQELISANHELVDSMLGAVERLINNASCRFAYIFEVCGTPPTPEADAAIRADISTLPQALAAMDIRDRQSVVEGFTPGFNLWIELRSKLCSMLVSLPYLIAAPLPPQLDYDLEATILTLRQTVEDAREVVAPGRAQIEIEFDPNFLTGCSNSYVLAALRALTDAVDATSAACGARIVGSRDLFDADYMQEIEVITFLMNFVDGLGDAKDGWIKFAIRYAEWERYHPPFWMVGLPPNMFSVGTTGVDVRLSSHVETLDNVEVVTLPDILAQRDLTKQAMVRDLYPI